jgi:hypothetical protein
LLNARGSQQAAEQDAAKTLASAGSKPLLKKPLLSSERLVRSESSQPLSKSVKMEDLRKYFHLPIVEVARQLGTCTTALKKICRKNKISKWPYRQIRSITKSIQSLEMASLNDTLNEELRIQYRQQIVTLQNAIDELIKDPNSVVELVNMGLSEEALQNLRESNAATFASAGLKHIGSDDEHGSHSSANEGTGGVHAPSSSSAGPKSGGYMVTTAGNGGAMGVLNLLQWPKPSQDVQQIMQAAAQLSTASDGAASGVARKTPGKSLKRKAGDSTEEGATQDSTEGTQGTGATVGPDGTTDVSQLEGGNLRHKKVEIGETLADCAFVAESQKMVFAGPVHLAPLQRKKLRPNITRKVVPLMEPDIGSNFAIEFIPQFVLQILHSAIGTGGTTTSSTAPAAQPTSTQAQGNLPHVPTQTQQSQSTQQPHSSTHPQAQAQHQASLQHVSSQLHPTTSSVPPASNSNATGLASYATHVPQNHTAHQSTTLSHNADHGQSHALAAGGHVSAQYSHSNGVRAPQHFPAPSSSAGHAVSMPGSYLDLQQAAGMMPTGPLHHHTLSQSHHGAQHCSQLPHPHSVPDLHSAHLGSGGHGSGQAHSHSSNNSGISAYSGRPHHS